MANTDRGHAESGALTNFSRCPISTAFRGGLVLIVAALSALVVHPYGLVTWCSMLPVSPATDLLYDVASQWADSMKMLGVTRPYEATREWFLAFYELRW